MPTLSEASVHSSNPKGGVQAWSVGETYPVTVVGLGNGPRTQWYAQNLHTGEKASVRDTYAEADKDAWVLFIAHTLET